MYSGLTWNALEVGWRGWKFSHGGVILFPTSNVELAVLDSAPLGILYLQAVEVLATIFCTK